MKSGILSLKGLFLFIILLVCSCDSHSYHYKILDYNLTFIPRANSTDVMTVLEITYFMDGKESKNEGFKFVGNLVVDSLTCLDETGPLRTNTEYLKETKISWYFNPVRLGTKKIKATFLLRGLAEMKGNSYVIIAPWAGVFRVPVSKASYTVLLPVNHKEVKCKEPGMWDHQVLGTIESFFHLQSPLTKKKINVQFEM
jgi:hypothetical protein